MSPVFLKGTYGPPITPHGVHLQSPTPPEMFTDLLRGRLRRVWGMETCRFKTPRTS